jgi:hypothetical protein
LLDGGSEYKSENAVFVILVFYTKRFTKLSISPLGNKLNFSLMRLAHSRVTKERIQLPISVIRVFVPVLVVRI